MARKCLLALTILLNAFQLASAAVITLPTANLTMPVANLTGPAANFCTDEPNWIGSGAYGLDCIGAVQRLYDTEIRSRRWPKSDFEFLTPKARESQIEAMRTPRKYTVSKDITDQDVEPDIIWETDNVEDTCTVAIVMLNYFSDTDLPGGIAGPFASRDVTSFWEIWEAARQIESVCVIHSGKPGWAAEGGREAIGVFMWSTDSDENKKVPDGEPMPPWKPSTPWPPVGVGYNSSMGIIPGGGLVATA